jgi:hypothetical protein
MLLLHIYPKFFSENTVIQFIKSGGLITLKRSVHGNKFENPGDTFPAAGCSPHGAG